MRPACLAALLLLRACETSSSRLQQASKIQAQELADEDLERAEAALAALRPRPLARPAAPAPGAYVDVKLSLRAMVMGHKIAVEGRLYSTTKARNERQQRDEEAQWLNVPTLTGYMPTSLEDMAVERCKPSTTTAKGGDLPPAPRAGARRSQAGSVRDRGCHRQTEGPSPAARRAASERRARHALPLPRLGQGPGHGGHQAARCGARRLRSQQGPRHHRGQRPGAAHPTARSSRS